jgi:hypothetical protein
MAKAKREQSLFRRSVEAAVEEILQRAKALARKAKELAGALLSPPSVVEGVPDVTIGLEPQRGSSSLFPRRDQEQVVFRPSYPPRVQRPTGNWRPHRGRG